MAGRGRTATLAVLLLLVFPTGCGPADAVEHFSAAASSALSAGEPIFRDLGGSCRRARALEDEIGSFAEPESDPACAAVAQQAEAAAAAAEALRLYFIALNALATYGKTDQGKTVGALATATASLAGAGTTVEQALGELATTLAAHAAGAPQRRLLARDLAAANRDVGVVTDALAVVVERNYMGQELLNEQEKLRIHYATFAREHPEGGVLLATDARWHAELAALEQRRVAAQALVEALRLVKEGTATLSTQSQSLRARQAEAAMAPYIAQLQTRTTAMQKVF